MGGKGENLGCKGRLGGKGDTPGPRPAAIPRAGERSCSFSTSGPAGPPRREGLPGEPPRALFSVKTWEMRRVVSEEGGDGAGRREKNVKKQ